MLFFNEKEAMGLEASLKLLDLSPVATIDDANQAYAYLHRMIDRFHRDTDRGNRGDRQEDLDLLTHAYEKAVAHISEPGPRADLPGPGASGQTAIVAIPQSTELCFAINVSPATVADRAHSVEKAVAIITRRLHEIESALPDAQQAVESAATAVEAAELRHDRARQATLTAVVAAKSAKTRALLLEIDAKRSMEAAIAVAEKARDRVITARQSARDARTEAEKAREQAKQIRKAEETTAAEAVCAEDRLENAKDRLDRLTHALLETRNRMQLFRDTPAMLEMHAPEAAISLPAPKSENRSDDPLLPDDPDQAARQQVMADLLEIEAALNAKKQAPSPVAAKALLPDGAGSTLERRRHHRIVYPPDKRPTLSFDNHALSVCDLSAAGMRLEPDANAARSPILRGVIAFNDRRQVKIIGKIVRQDENGLGLRLVTRIGNHILDQEHRRLTA